MDSRFKDKLQLYFAKDGIQKRAYIQQKLKAEAYDRLFDGIEVLDAVTKKRMMIKIQFLHNALYEKAMCRVDGFRRLSQHKIDHYNCIMTAPSYQNFEERLEDFIKKEVLAMETLLSRRIEAVARELIQKGCEEILDEKGMVRSDIAECLGITEPEALDKIRDRDVIRKIVNSFAAESVRQVGWALRTMDGNDKARETPCGIRIFDGVERGFQQAISGHYPIKREEERTEPEEQKENWNLTAMQRLFNARIPLEKAVTETLVQWGKSLFGPR